MVGAVLNTLNIRLDANTIALILEHAGTKLLIADREHSGTVKNALEQSGAKPLVIDVDDLLCDDGKILGEMDYETCIAFGDPEFLWLLPHDEWQAISLNYTSNTTGKP